VKTVRDVDAIAAACERSVSGLLPAWYGPRATLERLAAAVGRDDLSDRFGSGALFEPLEARVAALLGKEAAAFMPSGTMAQQAALRVHCDRRGLRTIGFHAKSHLELHEEKAYERLHRLHAVLVGHPNELIALADLEALGEPLAALLLELPQRELGGRLPVWDELAAQVEWARDRNVALHLDGARLWEAAPWYGRAYDEIAGLFDTVYISFYKGLGGVAGCALAGSAELVEEARLWQHRHGGRLPALYPYVLAAEVGLDRFLPQMEAWYRHAVEIARALAALDGVTIVPDPPQAPMMHLYLRGDRERLVDAALAVAEERRVWLFGRLRPTPVPELQLHELTVGEAALEVPAAEVAALYGEVLDRAAAA
jgi:threonine aldolase